MTAIMEFLLYFLITAFFTRFICWAFEITYTVRIVVGVFASLMLINICCTSKGNKK